ncbi:hypothetical protein [Aurantiacibacter marinus]|uniref:Phytoene synthase n=1 Tax=Aurantiacibacter marinus TaxID=874156 RepID=A0A0H0XP32_9SPHN|nr:hypothetical protein [Aurantiacibacter marinus]KLI64109.1 hypothetical protein AAV99_09560 [Aurantiacibacter marinus]
MDESLLDTLPLSHRLALSYAPASAKPDILALLALDARLAGIVRGDGEAIIAQMKLAWWRDRLGSEPENWPLGEPLLARLQDWSGDVSRLVALVDGWEVLLSEVLDRSAITIFCRGRSMAWSALADGLLETGTNAPIERAAKEASLLDLSQNLSQGEEADLARDLCAKENWEHIMLPRKLRPLAVLHALSRRALKDNRPHLLDGGGAMALAMRVGITGR